MTSESARSAHGMHHEGRGRWLGLAMLSLGVAMIIVDATIVNVAVPSIIRDLGLDSTAAEWVNTVYALVFAALLITLGRLGDVFGRRRMYVGGLAIFVASSMLAGLAPNGEILIAARLLQGIGGAMILPSTQSTLNANFQGRDRAIAFGIWGATIGGMAAVGPLLGGWLTTYLEWRWAFYINLPIGILAILGTLRFIGESRDERAQRGFDLPGFILITIGLAAFVFGLIEGRTYGWWEPARPFSLLGFDWPLTTISPIPFAIGGGLVILALFAWVELARRRAGRIHLFDFTLWSFRAFRFGNLAATIVALGEFGLLFALPLFLQAVLGYSAFETGLVLIALAVGAFFAAPAAAGLARRRGPRFVVTLGMALEAVGIIGTTLLVSPDASGLVLAVPLFIYGLGVGFATAQLTSIVLSEIPVERSGTASGANATLRQVGSALGIAIVGTVLFTTLRSSTEANLAAALPAMAEGCRALVANLVDGSAGQILPALRDPSALAGAASLFGGGAPDPAAAACFADPTFLASLPATVAPIEEAFAEATRLTGFVAAAFVILGVLFSLLLPRTSIHERTTAEVVESTEALAEVV